MASSRDSISPWLAVKCVLTSVYFVKDNFIFIRNYDSDGKPNVVCVRMIVGPRSFYLRSLSQVTALFAILLWRVTFSLCLVSLSSSASLLISSLWTFFACHSSRSLLYVGERSQLEWWNARKSWRRRSATGTWRNVERLWRGRWTMSRLCQWWSVRQWSAYQRRLEWWNARIVNLVGEACSKFAPIASGKFYGFARLLMRRPTISAWRRGQEWGFPSRCFVSDLVLSQSSAVQSWLVLGQGSASFLIVSFSQQFGIRLGFLLRIGSNGFCTWFSFCEYGCTWDDFVLMF